MYPLLQRHTEDCHCPKNPPRSTWSSLPPTPALVTTDLFTVRGFAFSRMSCGWNHAVCRLLGLPAVPQQSAFKFSPYLFRGCCAPHSRAAQSQEGCTPSEPAHRRLCSGARGGDTDGRSSQESPYVGSGLLGYVASLPLGQGPIT